MDIKETARRLLEYEYIEPDEYYSIADHEQTSNPDLMFMAIESDCDKNHKVKV